VTAQPDNQAKSLPLKACGEDVQIYPRARLVSPEAISIGDSVIIDDFVFLTGGKETRVGSFVHLASFSSFLGGGRLVIEDYAGVSSGTRVYTGTDDFLGDSLTGPTIPDGLRRPVRTFVHIGKYSVIGANCVVLPGVTIGEGCTVGALSLVNRDCEPWTIYAGTPARPIKTRRKDRIFELEAELRKVVYDARGRYIPRERR
jgi:acetyltransferase-like isoleucine patch superfamily enzyme